MVRVTEAELLLPLKDYFPITQNPEVSYSSYTFVVTCIITPIKSLDQSQLPY